MLISEALWIVAAAAAVAYIYSVPSPCETDFSGFIIGYLAFRALCGIVSSIGNSAKRCVVLIFDQVDGLLLRESSKGLVQA